MPAIRVNGTLLYYEEQGAGPGVIFVHGSWSDHGTWAAVVGPLGASSGRSPTTGGDTHGVSGHRSRGRPT
jgi:hypothetical protein